MATETQRHLELSLASISHDSVQDAEVTKAKLLTIHQQKLESEETIQQYARQIMDILGGIDQILTDYLSSNDIQLNPNQLKQLQSLITSEQTVTASHPDTRKEDATRLKYTFYKKDIIAYSIFNQQKAQKIFKFSQNKLVYAILSMWTLVIMVWTMLEYGHWSHFQFFGPL